MSNDIDILSQLDSIDLNSVETARPNLPSGMFPVRVVKMELVDQKAPKTGKNLSIQLALVEPAQSVPNSKGETQMLQPGFPVFDLISLTKTFRDDGTVKYDPLPRLAKFREAVKGDKAGQFLPLEQYIGMTVMVRTKYSVDPEYGPRTNVQDYVRKS